LYKYLRRSLIVIGSISTMVSSGNIIF